MVGGMVRRGVGRVNGRAIGRGPVGMRSVQRVVDASDAMRCHPLPAAPHRVPRAKKRMAIIDHQLPLSRQERFTTLRTSSLKLSVAA